MTKRNTIQKEVVARIVKDACNHPTADMVLAEAKKKVAQFEFGHGVSHPQRHDKRRRNKGSDMQRRSVEV